ncbi:VOC family protein [Rathayibacter soli]|uniref:VOC family protein n=1 Tax=Rathayibacter soli TaxID=3144168 RepID=UPI0027E4F20A|nr:VOC family protein [Glaciibacter superstes]
MTTSTITPTLTSLQTGHVALNVSELERSKAFYQRLLGLSIAREGTDEGRRWVFLGRDGRLVLTLFQQSSGRFSTSTPGLHHLSFQVENMDQVRAAEVIAHELNAPFFHDSIVAHSEGSNSGGIFFADPDGIRLEIFAPSGAEESPAPSGEAPTCGFF